MREINRNRYLVIGIAYIVGLLATGNFAVIYVKATPSQLLTVGLGLAGLSILLAVAIPRWWRRGPKFEFWLISGVVAIIAMLYMQWRIPSPATDDVSHIITEKSQVVEVVGKVISSPQHNQSDRLKFWFQPQQVIIEHKQRLVTGKLYVTVPSSSPIIYPQQQLLLEGVLYTPTPAVNPGAFDFKQYLQRSGAYAGLKADRVMVIKSSSPWLWQLRQRIISSQSRWLESPKGLLLSSIVLGRRAVDLPYDIRDRFIGVGLAHILAASGFHVSLLLGFVLLVTKRLGSRTRLGIGITILLIYIGLTGVQPSVIRAALMGVGALVGLVTERKIIPTGSLFLAAWLMLLVNPLWIWDLGFQLSFLATFGLIVGVAPIVKQLDWLPPTVANAVAIPLAATIWTLPLIMYVFKAVATYSILVNLIATPLITLVSLGGMISAAAAIIFPPVGAAVAYTLNYPIELLIGIVTWFNSLPGGAIAVGQINLGTLIITYGILALIWFHPQWRSHWQPLACFLVALIVVPIVFKHLTQVQVTVLASKTQPAIVIQNRGKIAVVSSSDLPTLRYTIAPFLRYQGINRVDWAIALSTESDWSGWEELAQNIQIKQLLTPASWQPKSNSIPVNSLAAVPKIKLGNSSIRLIDQSLEIIIDRKRWLLIGDSYNLIPNSTDKYDVVWWFGRSIQPETIAKLEAQTAIASSYRISQSLQEYIDLQVIQLYYTGRDGAITWTPQYGFQTYRDLKIRNSFW